jgi:hypothetical protein
MKVEGIRDPEGVRDFLYSKMRGVREGHGAAQSEIPNLKSQIADDSHPDGEANRDELLLLLTDIRDELRKRNGRSS